jgi:hypothetical protein
MAAVEIEGGCQTSQDQPPQVYAMIGFNCNPSSDEAIPLEINHQAKYSVMQHCVALGLIELL